MCGINGIIKYKNKSLSANIKSMNDLIIHRGPDDDGMFNEVNNDYSIALGMRRLSIIDLSSGGQPMYSDDKSVIIVFNGEIYNFKTLKIKLLEKKVTFNTKSDTEVILKGYLEFGVEIFSYLDGMFAFSIYDKKKNKIYIARDFFGEKPLYYSINKDGFIWSSELKSILPQIENKPKISHQSLNLYFSLTYIPAPYSIYEDVFKLEPNKYIEYSIDDKKLSINKIHPNNEVIKFKGSFNEAKEITRKLVNESVASRSISDVPIGTFLSGGVDSSIVSYCLSQNSENRIDTFSVGFNKKKFDETDKSRMVSKLINSKHHEFIIDEKSLYSDIDQILYNFDEPFADSSAIPTYLVANKTSNHVKVALTGDGGDEVFAGYNKYNINFINNNYISFVPQKAHNFLKKSISFLLKNRGDNRGFKFKLKKVIDSIDYNGNFYWNIISLGFKEYEINKILKNSNNGIFDYYKEIIQLDKKKSLSDLRNIDRHISLEGDMLVKVDRTSMLSSLECRAPFLNKKLWDFSNTLPEKYLINGTSKKFILKESFKDFFPSNFLERSKHGFGVPVGDWLRTVFRNELLYLSEKKFIEEQNLFIYSYIKELISRHLNGQEDNTFKVWTYFCFQKWYKKSYLNK